MSMIRPGRHSNLNPSAGEDFIPNAESLVSPFRIACLAIVCVTYFLFFDRSQYDERISLPLLALIAAYCFWVQIFRPDKLLSYRVSRVGFTVVDAIFVSLWTYATGGASSPYYVIMYAGLVPSALRLNTGYTMVTAGFYAGLYLLTVGFSEHSQVNQGLILLRVSFVFVIGGLASLLGREIRDRSLKVLAANQSLNLENSLRRTVEKDLRAKQEQLAAVDRRKDEFLAMLSHELRNPLASMYAAVALIDSEDPHSDRKPQAIRVLNKQLHHLVRLVDDLLDVARVTEGKVRLQLQEVDLYDVLAHSIEVCESECQRRGHAVHFNRPAREKIILNGDPTRLEQVFSNLLNNAAKYTEAAGQIWILVSHSGSEVTVRVKDSGIGMSREMLERAFELFVQGDATLDRTRGGLGIGLTLAKDLVEKHGGRISATSLGLGCGSEFIVTLPIREVRLEPLRKDLTLVSRAKMGVPGLAGSLRVLLVEDAQDVGLLIQTLLIRWGFEVSLATDGQMALDQFDQVRPQLVLLDIGLPLLDGFEVARRIREDRSNDSVFLVALSGYGQPVDKRRALEAGFDLHLTKPVRPEVLKSTLDDIARKIAAGSVHAGAGIGQGIDR